MPEVPAEIREKELAAYPKLAAQLLYNRNIIKPDEAEYFLNPKYENLHNPFLFQDMGKAVERIWKAIEDKEKICIYGDYDADAVTANAVLQQTFRYLGVEVESYIPDRFTEGYGINMEALSKIKDEGSKILITVDCGTNSVEAAEFCEKNGIDFIITDHHEIIGPVPEAYALINPKNPNDKYPYSEITRVGVAFKMAQAILTSDKCKVKSEKYIEGYEKWLLDLVAIGTVADCHSLMGENRILVKFGLKVLQKTKWAGLKALALSSGLDFSVKAPDTYSLGFVIAPRLNAAGRLEHANTALYLLMEKDPTRAAERAQELESINKRRQDQTARILSQAREQAELIKDRKILVLANEGWSKGVVGLVAGKLAEEFNRPVIVLSQDETELTGSARTTGEFDIIESLKWSAEFLVRFGGHKQAAGLTLKKENFESFYQKLLDYAEINLKDAAAPGVLYLESELIGSDLSLDTCHLLHQFEPFGVDNHKPKFLIPNAKIISTKPVGAEQQHLQLRLQIEGRQIASIYFNCGNFAKNLKIGDTIDIAAELMEDGWNGRREVKLRIVDLKMSKN